MFVHARFYSHKETHSPVVLRLGAQQLMSDEGSYLHKGNLLCLWNAKTKETVHEGQKPKLIESWEDMLHSILKSSIAYV